MQRELFISSRVILCLIPHLLSSVYAGEFITLPPAGEEESFLARRK
jgi:hypothetical protein